MKHVSGWVNAEHFFEKGKTHAKEDLAVCICMCMHARACLCGCTCVYVCTCVSVSVHMCLYVCRMCTCVLHVCWEVGLSLGFIQDMVELIYVTASKSFPPPGAGTIS